MDIQNEFDSLLSQIAAYNPNADFDRIRRAYTVAREAHKDQKRVAGDPYIVHPLAVAKILAELELDNDSIIAGILHDCIEDTTMSYQDIKTQFGVEVADLVDGVTKLGKIPYSSKEEQQVENLRKMFLAMAKDVRVILIKLADRLHNMRTIDFMPDDKRRQKALETMEVYSPLAHRLGMSKIKTELEDISIRCLDPIGYNEIVEFVSHRMEETSDFVSTIKEKIGGRLLDYGIKYEIKGRVKNIYSIYRKVYGQNRGFDEVYDLFAVRVIVDTVIDCYNVLGIIHDMYKPIPGRFKDYISTPKPNMYQSLHTTVIGSDGLIFEVQIRTVDMDKTAELGIAAHWKYKAGVSGTDMDAKLSWIRQLLEIQKDSSEHEEFMRALKIDMFADEVFVFTPQGDVISLPSGSTIIDFAYAIHSAVGNRMIGAKVDGRIMPLDTTLENGAVVEIITSGGAGGPSLDWLKIAKSSSARNKIRQWFKKEKREENIERGKAELEKELRRNGIPFGILEQKDILTSVLKKYHVNNLEELYASIGFGGIQLSNFIVRLTAELKRREEEKREKDPEELQKKVNEQAQKRVKKDKSGVVVEGIDNVLVKLARCCSPLPGDDIIGYITKGFGVSVHKKDCPNVTAALSRDGEEARWIPVHWSESDTGVFTSVLQVIANKRTGLLVDVVNLISNMRIPMHSLNAKDTKDGYETIQVAVEVQNLTQLSGIITKLRKIQDVVDVSRNTR